MKALKREKEITPRLEAAARRDSKNVPLQYVLADRYRETGENEKAEALYQELLKSRPNPQTYRALASSLLKRRKAGDLLQVTAEALGRPENQGANTDAIKPLLGAVVADDTMSDEMLDVGLHQLETNPASFTRQTYLILSFIAIQPRARDHRTGCVGWRSCCGSSDCTPSRPRAMSSRARSSTRSRRMGKFAEAADVNEQLLAKHPTLKTAPNLVSLADLHRPRRA